MAEKSTWPWPARTPAGEDRNAPLEQISSEYETRRGGIFNMILWATHSKSLASAQFELETGIFQLGRETPNDPEDKLPVPFDPKLSRRTVRIEVKNSSLSVKREGSRAPIFYQGKEQEVFELLPGERFSVADTVFELMDDLAQTIIDEGDEDAHIRPDELLKTMVGIQELLESDNLPLEHLGERINELLPNSKVALFRLDPFEPLGEVSLVPSRSLISQAYQNGEPVYYEWSSSGVNAPTAFQGESWALAAPIFSAQSKLLLYCIGHSESGESQRGALCLLAKLILHRLEAQSKLPTSPEIPRVLLRVFSLGGFEAHYRDTRLDQTWGGNLLSWALSYLSAANKPVTEERLLEDFWPEKAGRAKKSLSVMLTRLRKAFREVGFEDSAVPRKQLGYSLHNGLTLWHDYGELIEILKLVEATEPAELLQHLDQGHRLVALDRGEYLEGCYLEWAVRLRDDLERRLQQSYEKFGRNCLEAERFEEALSFSELSLKYEPCSQESHLVVLQAHVGLGHPEQAVRQFRVCEKTLKRELDMEPSMELLEAYHRARLSIG